MTSQPDNSRKLSDKLWCLFRVHNYETVDSGPYASYWDGELYKVSKYYDLRCRCCGIVKKVVV